MLPDSALAELEKQQYRVVGTHKHSAVKVCGWTKNMIRGKGGCYKLKFYGIKSNQCLQMTTAFSCASRCVFCWRGYKSPVAKEWMWEIDAPEPIITEALAAHYDLLQGFGGSSSMNRALYDQSKSVKHVALSLTGEPIIYPRINEMIALFHAQGISTFMVTNGQYPEQIRDLAPVTQLYLSVDAPNQEMLKEIDKPAFPDFWERSQQSLQYLREKKGRTTIRLTMVKGVNMVLPEQYAELIKKGDPDFVEVKGYMFVGASRQKLKLENMPYHEDVHAFTLALAEHLPEYLIASEHTPSRVVLLAKKDYFISGNPETWIDFDAFFALWQGKKGKEIVAKEYSVRWTKHSTTDMHLKEMDESIDETKLE
jgi:tRNA wybutosine-synthesizing protein 1